ncbi:Excinuclease ABC C subunit domain protein, partial [mine drainage metagenome]
MSRAYHVYIMASRSRVLYVGVTGNLPRRLREHRLGLLPGFTQRYRVKQLVYLESTLNVTDALAREKQIKGWTRARKIALIESQNPG